MSSLRDLDLGEYVVAAELRDGRGACLALKGEVFRVTEAEGSRVLTSSSGRVVPAPHHPAFVAVLQKPQPVKSSRLRGRARSVLAAVGLCALAGQAWAQKGPGYRLQEVITAVGTAGSVIVQYTTSAGATIPACLPFGSRPYWQAVGGAVAIAYTMDRDINFAADINATTGHHLNDDEVGPRNSPAVGMRLASGERSHSLRGIVDYQQVYSAPGGARSGLCTTELETPSGKLKRFPCLLPTDCSNIAAGTCELEASLQNTVGGDLASYRSRVSCAFVRVQADTNPTVLSGNL